MRCHIRINGRFFNNSYDATKYLVKLASRGEAITILQDQHPTLEDVIRHQ